MNKGDSDLSISIIMPVYNTERVLSDSINSVLAQTWKDWELILVDDGSTDQSGLICDSFCAKDDRVRIVHTANKGVSSARNTGLLMAQREWIVFVDSDDQLVSNALEKMLLHSTDVNLVVYGYETFPVARTTQFAEDEICYVSYLDTVPDFHVLYQKGFNNSVCTKMIRRRKITAKFDVSFSLGEDVLFCMEYMKNCGAIRVIPDILYRYRVGRVESLTNQCRMDAIQIQSEIKAAVDNAFHNDPRVTSQTTNVFTQMIIGNMQLLVYDGNLSKDDKIEILSQWIIDSQYAKAVLVTDNCKKVDYKMVMHYSINGNAAAIYRIFSIKKKLFMAYRWLRLKSGIGV